MFILHLLFILFPQTPLLCPSMPLFVPPAPIGTAKAGFARVIYFLLGD